MAAASARAGTTCISLVETTESEEEASDGVVAQRPIGPRVETEKDRETQRDAEHSERKASEREAIDLTMGCDGDSSGASAAAASWTTQQRRPPRPKKRPRPGGAEQCGFVAQRLALDALPRLRLGRRADPRHARSITVDELQTFGAALPSRTLSLAEARAFRDEVSERFRLSGTRRAFLHDERNYLDQSSLAACSFAGFLQLLHLSGALQSLDVLITCAGDATDSKRWAWWTKQWGAVWEGMLASKTLQCGDKTPHVEDIAHMLDLLPRGSDWPHPSFVYVPVRSAGNSEMSFDQSWWDANEDDVACQFGVDAHAYREMPWVYQTARRVEALLRREVAVGFNSDQHTRVAIACDDTHLLCVDSYGPRHQEGHEHRFWRAGLSVVEKWQVYNWVRELMWIQDQS